MRKVHVVVYFGEGKIMKRVRGRGSGGKEGRKERENEEGEREGKREGVWEAGERTKQRRTDRTGTDRTLIQTTKVNKLTSS